MPDTAKKTKAPAKPGNTATKKETAVPAAKPTAPAREATERPVLKAEAAKKTKAPSTPRKAAAKKAKADPAARPALPHREEIERLAREFWAARGYQDGFAEQDWLRAERELLQKAS